jgi:ribosomal-protein-alanine N-acetyltransferase
MSLEDLFTVFPTLVTERLILREISLKDAHDFLNYYANPQVTKHLDWNGPSSIKQAKEVISAWNNGFKNKAVIPWGITLKTNNKLIGTIPYIPIRGTFLSQPLQPTVVGFELSQDYWNKGIISEALKAVIAFGFNKLGSHRIQAEVFPENSASLHVLKKIGFQEEGLLKKYLYHEETRVFNDIILLSLLRMDADRTGLRV